MAVFKVALAGKGRLGSVVLKELLRAGFDVTVLSRSSTPPLTNVPDGVQVRKVDYTSHDSLVSALKDHDAVVSTVAGVAVASQKPLIDAAISTGVKHFIPADYAMSLRNPEVRLLPPYTDVLEVEKYLRARSEMISWTIVACGGFLEYCFDLTFMIDLAQRRIDLVNGGEVPFSISDFGTVARAIAVVLQQPERVVDHCVQVHGMLATQKEVLEIARKYDPKPECWIVNKTEAHVKFADGLDMLKRGEYTMAAVSTLMAGVVWDARYQTGFQETDNEWLGVEMLYKERLEETIKGRLLDGVSGIASDRIVSTIQA